MRLSFVFICLLMIGCSQKEPKNYVQVNEIQLTQPKVFASNTIIDSSVVLTADLRMKDVQIFYTNDDTEPTQKSTLYQKSLTIKEPGEYQFKAFHSDWKPSETVSIDLFKKGITPDQIDWKTNAHPSYPDEDLLSLINHKKGSLNFRDIEWTGFDSIAKATMHFKERTYVSSVTVGFLIDTKSWIFPPHEISIYLNENQRFFAIEETADYIKSDLKELESSNFFIDEELDSITIVIKNLQKLPNWHPGKGNKAWLFLDEFIFNE